MTMDKDNRTDTPATTEQAQPDTPATVADASPATVQSGVNVVPEIGGPKGPEPTRYGDWERRGRCIDF